MRRLTIFGLALLAIAFCAWLYAAPYITVRAMQTAADRGDADTLASHVDFPALRESVKQQLAAQLASQLAASASSNSGLERFGAQIAGALGAANIGNTHLGDAMLATTIDNMVSPQALSALIAGRGFARDYLPLASTNNTPPAFANIDVSKMTLRMGYESFNTFAVNLEETANSGTRVKAILRRENLLWWKLCAIEISTS